MGIEVLPDLLQKVFFWKVCNFTIMITIDNTAFTSGISFPDILAVQTKAELLQICKKLDLYVSPNLKKDETVHRVAVAMMTNPINILSVFNKQELLIVNFPPVSIWPSAESNRRHPNSWGWWPPCKDWWMKAKKMEPRLESVEMTRTIVYDWSHNLEVTEMNYFGPCVLKKTLLEFDRLVFLFRNKKFW